ncbi:Holliday junction branch migration protein RuvA [Methylacidiphilum caldifontis]|uniref:Holliday junction branch migration complex subunit RuvA n=1 Tax=Methylacidiphilum caldifontis TaxID=2795386 RepID=A0A4Y8PBE1_9BACT|nr:Holliday junction branch migration protein RuvA [Methylacidiphilum caldifontis]TFE66964.1 Holliday junction DNA helicase RuvA [Methylacidiphilum caldifontis]
MISYLKGTLIYCSFPNIIVAVQGIGFELFSSLSLYRNLPSLHSEIALYTHLVVSENRIELFGFNDLEEQLTFRLLIDKVHGVGPRTALSILNVLSPKELKDAVAKSDVPYLSKIKGVGEKTAQRLIVELKDKLTTAGPSSTSSVGVDRVFEDALRALVALGYKEAEALKRLRRVREKYPQMDLEGIIKECLKQS